MSYQSGLTSEEPPERELSSAEVVSTNTDAQTLPDPSSSVLSEGWCSSVLGKPCAKVRIRPQGSNASDRGELEQGLEDNIGNLFGKDNDSRKPATPKREPPRAQGTSIREPEKQQPFETESSPNQDILKNSQSNRNSGEALVNDDTSPENSQENLPNQERRSLTPEFPEGVATDFNSGQNTTGRDALQNTQPKSNKRRDSEKNTDIAKERDKDSLISNSEQVQIEKNKLRRLICYCDENSQTPPPSILKPKPVSKSDPVFSNERTRKSPKGKMEAGYPEREFPRRSSRDSQKIVLTSDKVQQTSDDLFFSPPEKNTASNTDRLETTETSINTFNTESVKVQTSERSSTTPEEEQGNFWYEGRGAVGRLCRCSPPRLSALRHQGSFSSPSVSPRTVDSYRSDRTWKTPRKKSTAKRQQDTRHLPEESGGGGYTFCVPPTYQECPIYTCQQAAGMGRQHFKPPRPVLPKQKPKTPSLQRTIVVPCDGSCRRFPRNKPESRRIVYQPPPAPYRPPAPPHYSGRFESSSSDEGVEDEDDEEEDDSDGYTSDGSSRKHSDLPYQNNEEYLELVQELEETLQSRNRNRVNRAMKEFEHKSKYNRPLERPIINYGEPSESEEPIMRKISELTEKRRSCKGDCCGCRKDEIRDRQTPRPPPRMKQQAAKPWKNSKSSPREHPRWQMDEISGEWFKICQNLSKRPSPATPKKEHVCGCSCSCGR